MRKSFALIFALILLAAVAAPQTAPAPKAATSDQIALPRPSLAGGMSLHEALARRRSVRSFAPTKLTEAELSQLLWAAQGITDDHGRRTAPSARAAYYLHLYVATTDGVFEYLPAGHQLKRLASRDVRAALSSQAMFADAPAVFLVTGEYERASQRGAAEMGRRFVDLEAGHAAQNLLLEAVALGLGAVPAGGVQPAQVQQAASLPAVHMPIYLIPVGHPK